VILRDDSFLSLSGGSVAYRWSSTSGELLNTFYHEGLECFIFATELKEDLIVATGCGEEVKVWSLLERNLVVNNNDNIDTVIDNNNDNTSNCCQCLGRLRTPSAVCSMLGVVRSPMTNTLLCGLSTGTILLCCSKTTVNNTFESIESIARLEGHTDIVISFCELSDGTVISGSYEDMRRWDINTRECITIFTSTGEFVQTVAELHDGTIVSLSEGDGSIRFWNSSTGECINSEVGGPSLLNRVDRASGFVWMPDGTLVIAYKDDVLRVWNRKGELKQSMLLLMGTIKSIALLKRSGSLVLSIARHTGDYPGCLEVRDTWIT